MIVLRVMALVWRASALYPDATMADLVDVSYAAALEETPAVPAEILLAIAEHESRLRPNAVSWRGANKRVDILWMDGATMPRGSLACGLVQTIVRDRSACIDLLDPVAAMRAGVVELDEELRACRGEMTCALSAYAGGNAGLAAWRAGETTDATRFAYLFAARARQLGWSPSRSRV